MATNTTLIEYIEGAAAATPGAGKVVTYAKADGLMYSKDDAGTETPLGGGGGGATFKYLTRSGAGDYTTSSTSKVAIDGTNLGYLTFTLAIGDVVRCVLNGQVLANVGVGGFDFEVDQPTSGNVFIGAGNDMGVSTIGAGATRYPLCATGMFVATEAGVHGFRPAWVMESGGTSVVLCNAASGNSDSLIMFSAEKLGPVTP